MYTTPLLLTALLLFTSFIFNNKNQEATKKPHIIIIIGDDMGWNDIGFHGSNQIPTPNLDALGYNGVILNKFYSQHICTPSRAALLTGNYPIRSGMQGLPLKAGENRSLPTNMRIMPELFKQLGYKTHLVGKWHLGAAYRENTPTKRGFDTHFGYWNGFVGYFNYFAEQNLTDSKVMVGLDLHDSFQPVWSAVGQYATELFTKKSLEVIDNHKNNEPLFLVLAHLAAHTGKDGVELGVPDINQTNNKYNYINDPLRRRYAEVVNLLDDSIGQVTKKLADKKMLDNSIVLFLSDNGAQTVGIYENRGSNWPLRGLKFSLHEGGVRTICTVYSPLFKKQGYVSQELIHITDWLPTLYTAAGGDLKDLGTIDGVNQWETLSTNSPSNRNEILLNIDEVMGYSGIITNGGRYKLLNGSYKNGIYDDYYGDDGRDVNTPPYNITSILQSDTNLAIQNSLTEEKILGLRTQTDFSWCRINETTTSNFICTDYCLFDLYKDPCESRNIIENETIMAKKLKKQLDQFFTQLIPQTNKLADPKADPIYYNNTWCTWLDDTECFKTI